MEIRFYATIMVLGTIGCFAAIAVMATVVNAISQFCRPRTPTPVVVAPPPPPKSKTVARTISDASSVSTSSRVSTSSSPRPNLPVEARARVHSVPYRVEYFAGKFDRTKVTPTESAIVNPRHGGVTIRRNVQRDVMNYLSAKGVTLRWGDVVSFETDRFGDSTSELTIFNGRDIVSMDYTADQSGYRLPQCMTVVDGGLGCPPNYWSAVVEDHRVWFNASAHKTDLLASKVTTAVIPRRRSAMVGMHASGRSVSRSRADSNVFVRSIRVREVVYNVWYMSESQFIRAIDTPGAIPCTRRADLSNSIFLGDGWVF